MIAFEICIYVIVFYYRINTVVDIGLIYKRYSMNCTIPLEYNIYLITGLHTFGHYLRSDLCDSYTNKLFVSTLFMKFASSIF